METAFYWSIVLLLTWRPTFLLAYYIEYTQHPQNERASTCKILLREKCGSGKQNPDVRVMSFPKELPSICLISDSVKKELFVIILNYNNLYRM